MSVLDEQALLVLDEAVVVLLRAHFVETVDGDWQQYVSFSKISLT